ncbi:uncharacterized protein BDZ99DRAFT_515897 [Mytilinidion resinicola]|uniref:Mediator of RNA polymerase II transcription subunit 11 n=1 Tax=Mytilinidion resinicola TaxID=574789 RepID=A0A6A6Z4H0_9PEZI|nr:uncharacterized protein BDZ99DRAFT_515897 [Mytilinidion resinicola]KAF2815147.1 hypothetical protein BDZ99DRAFT_515897 [Mytilinidion resinicola]
MADTPKTRAEQRIQELSAINAQIPQILINASSAIRALTNSSSSSSNNTAPASLAAHKATFQTSTRAFFTLITQISAQLTDQARALEAAGIIPPTNAKAASREMTGAEAAALLGAAGGGPAGAIAGAQVRDSEATVTNGGLGELDVGWLNARAGDVGRGMEAEVLARVREILEGVGGEVVREKEDREMGGV